MIRDDEHSQSYPHHKDMAGRNDLDAQRNSRDELMNGNKIE